VKTFVSEQNRQMMLLQSLSGKETGWHDCIEETVEIALRVVGEVPPGRIA